MKMWFEITIYSGLLAIVACNSSCNGTSVQSLHLQNTHTQTSRSGDYVIHSLFTITKNKACSEITYDGVLRVLAVKYAIERINRSPTLLPGIQLGYVFDDACFDQPVTMHHGVEIVRNAREGTCAISNNNTCQQTSKPVVAVLGSYYTFNCVNLANLLSLHRIPQISDGASSPLLSDQRQYRTFFRTIQWDYTQVQVMIEVLKRFNWTYIVAVGSDDDYGRISLNELKEKSSREQRFCVVRDLYMTLQTNRMVEAAREIVQALKRTPLAKVVVMFNYPKGMAEHILREAEVQNVKRVWLTSEAWNPEILTTKNVPVSQTESLLTVSLQYGGAVDKFKEYIRSRVPQDYLCDVWLKLLIKQKFNCTVQSRNASSFIGISNDNSTSCAVKIYCVVESLLKENLKQVNFLIDAVNAVGHSLHAAACNGQSPCVKDVRARQLVEYLANVSFITTSGRVFEFNKKHNPKFSAFSLEQIQLVGSKPTYVRVGWWENANSSLELDTHLMVWPEWLGYSTPVSRCSKACAPGERMVGKQRCCWKCEACLDKLVSNTTNSDRCHECPEGYHTKNRVHCEKTPVRYITLSHPIGIAMVCISVLGIVITMAAFAVFLLYRGKAANFMQESVCSTITSLVLPLATFAYTFVHLTKPSLSMCSQQAAYFHLLYTLYGCLILGKNRAIRRFISKCNKNKTYECLTLLMAGVLLTEMVILAVWLSYLPPCVHQWQREFEIYLRCKYKDTVAALLAAFFPSALLLLATVQSIPERQTTYRSGEPKMVCYCGVALTLLVIAFGVTLSQVNEYFHTLTILVTSNGFAYIYIGCLILPKCYIAVSKLPGRNITGASNSSFALQDIN